MPAGTFNRYGFIPDLAGTYVAELVVSMNMVGHLSRVLLRLTVIPEENPGLKCSGIDPMTTWISICCHQSAP